MGDKLTNLDETRRRLDREAWLGKLARRGKRIIGDERNTLLAFRNAPDLAGLIRFNEFALRAEFNRPPPWRKVKVGDVWSDDDDTAALAWLQAQGVEVRQRHVVANTVSLIAKEAAYHPVRDYLSALKWDGVPRLNIWLADYLNATADPLYLGAVGRRFLISAVARVQQPGCQVDHVLVTESPQGGGKSTAARVLAGRDDWFTDAMPDVHSKDAAIQVSGHWVVELSELAALRRSDIEAMKGFLTRRIDVFRQPYARRTCAVPRQCVFVGSTNQKQYLRDPTGNRRFWPVSCARIDLEALARDRDQLWAEAVVAYQGKEAWYLTPEETALAVNEQAERVLVTELQASVNDYLARLSENGIGETDTRRVMIEALSLQPDKSDFIERAGRIGSEVAAAMCAARWRKIRVTGRGANRRNVYQKPL